MLTFGRTTKNPSQTDKGFIKGSNYDVNNFPTCPESVNFWRLRVPPEERPPGFQTKEWITVKPLGKFL